MLVALMCIGLSYFLEDAGASKSHYPTATVTMTEMATVTTSQFFITTTTDTATVTETQLVAPTETHFPTRTETRTHLVVPTNLDSPDFWRNALNPLAPTAATTTATITVEKHVTTTIPAPEADRPLPRQ
jgi:hypothetical protein